MIRRLVAACLLLALPAEAAESPAQPAAAPVASASVDVPGKALGGLGVGQEPPLSKYEWSWNVIPLPFVLVLVGGELKHTPGPLDHYGFATAAGTWFGRDLYDPRSTTQEAVAGYTSANEGFHPYFDGRLAYGLNLSRQIRLYLLGHHIGSNIEPNAGNWLAKERRVEGVEKAYDPDALVSGAMNTVGPRLEADYTNDPSFPTSGFKGRLSADFGLAALGNRTKSGRDNDFALYRGQAQAFMPFGSDRTLVFNVTGGVGRGKIPILLRYNAGGASFLRGYISDRFGGDQVLVSSAEWRHLAIPHLPLFPDVGLGYRIFVDVGRVWESSCETCTAALPSIPFPQDIRPGAGAGMTVHLGRSTLLTLDVAYGSEGFTQYPPSRLPLIPGVGASFTETW